MSMKTMWGINEWESSVLNNPKIPDNHPLKAKDGFNLKAKKTFSSGPEGKAVVAALTAFDEAEKKYAGNQDLKSREDALKAMDASSRDFKAHFDALNSWVIQKVNPLGKGFSKELNDEWTKMVHCKDKVASAMNVAVATARKAIETLNARQPLPPQRPQGAAPPRPQNPPPNH
jgi:hypothetical protein